jgi:hypothetical protein
MNQHFMDNSPLYALLLAMICLSILDSCVYKEPTIIEPPVESCINEVELPEKECILVA